MLQVEHPESKIVGGRQETTPDGHQRMTTYRVLMRYALAALVVALVVSGCGGLAGGKTDRQATTTNVKLNAPSGSVREAMYEWLDTVSECMDEAGWPVDVIYVEYGLPSRDNISIEQIDSFRKTMASCREAAGRAPGDFPMTAAHASMLFDHMVEMKSCLEGMGFTVSEPTSHAVFVDRYLNYAGEPPWSPFLDLPGDLTEEEWREINTKCPQDVDDQIMLDDLP